MVDKEFEELMELATSVQEVKVGERHINPIWEEHLDSLDDEYVPENKTPNQ